MSVVTKLELARKRAIEEREMAEHYRGRAAGFEEVGDAEEGEIRRRWAVEADLEAEIFEDTARRLESYEQETI